MSKIWIFDLDDTLHDASSKIFPRINQSMTAYVSQKLNISHDAAHELRDQYWKVYGATLKGLMENHDVDPKEFLLKTHDAHELSKFVKQSHALKNTLKKLKGKKIVFTNAPLHYAIAIIKSLKIERHFSAVYSIETTKYNPKPSLYAFRKILRHLGEEPHQCTMVEDDLANLKTAHKIGMKTVLVSRQNKKTVFINKRITKITHLTAQTR
ncbi:pyrimidine 5'-nucleotidase [Candidatus Methylopumilus planktonicus]|uniref:pyrimidine 5'-nucleotidase n=1 Tax=Candidatus Methylopumilus planktonicus TaxID=1581557 RepID=UPI00111FD732|nr:pyrimidine 5'-nucleotidase [Candidatus Methylopumilus planktonicus]QDD11283.1 pyrimidine 5'-nucleotidase [Candidatus Methylopumilus planktonicus]QDD23753.1 pyrimidine 5'-nucleotidase [Candidatus Methylopumilus planktonicus]